MTDLVNADFAELVTASFDKQNAMHLIRATLPVVEHGRTEIFRLATFDPTRTLSPARNALLAIFNYLSRQSA